MDRPFPLTAWQPTKPPHRTEEDLSRDLPDLIATLNAQTVFLSQYPYDPTAWLRRAETLVRLGYPELVVGDTHKAILLIRSLGARVAEGGGVWRLGFSMGFWMREAEEDEVQVKVLPDGGLRVEGCGEKVPDGGAEVNGGVCVHGDGKLNGETGGDSLGERLVKLRAKVHRLQAMNLAHYPQSEEGRFTPRPYPWMQPKHSVRSNELLAQINREFTEAVPKLIGDNGKPYCVVRRHAFGESSRNGKDSNDVLGVFATRDIARDTVIAIDPTQTWGCSGPRGCSCSLDYTLNDARDSDLLLARLPSKPTHQDLGWIRGRAGDEAATAVLRCRFLLRCHADATPHPLDHPLIARLTPTYRQEKIRRFSLENDIAIPNACLQRLGVDIFSAHVYDTWVLFTLEARIANNSWNDPAHFAISPLFSLFNHSCEPNTVWRLRPDHITVVLRCGRAVKAGEQLLLVYDEYMSDQPLAERRARLRKWFDAECQCSRCVREEEDEQREWEVTGMALRAQQQQQREQIGMNAWCAGSVPVPAVKGVPAWDTAEKPVFPEDAPNGWT